MRALFASATASERERSARGARDGERAREATSAWVRDFDGPSASDDARATATTTATTTERAHPLAREWGRRIASTAVRREFLNESIDAYTERRPLRVFAGTWNTNGKAPRADADVKEWVRNRGRLDEGEGGTWDDDDAADVVAVGFQEIVPLNVGKVLVGEDSAMTEAWERVLDKALNGSAANQPATKRRGVLSDYTAEFDADDATEASFATTSGQATPETVKWVSFDGGDEEEDISDFAIREGSSWRPPKSKQGAAKYRPVAQKQLVGVYITVWVKASLLPHIQDVRVGTVATGFNIGVGILGNKGACAVWMKLYSTPLVFVCSHLSAGSKPGDEIKRNEDYSTIMDQLRFLPPEGADASEYSVADAASSIWMGDLNYRLTLSDDVVRKSIAAGNYSSLLASDQLNIERSAGRAFKGWHESEVTFAPTYKYRPGTNIYSGAGDADLDEVGGSQRKEEEKKRTPAWCDRVLWNGDFDINLLEYGRAELTHSDHKPVYAVFSLVVRELEPKKLHSLLFDLRRKLDHVEMASMPVCAIENASVDLGRLRYSEEVAGKFRLSNVGDVPANFSLVSPIPGGPATPGWMSVYPMSGSLLPGEEVILNVTACVRGGRRSGPSAFSHDSLTRYGDDSLIHVDAKPKHVDAILVVRLEGGRDFFVSVQGTYQPCTFGTPFEDLPTSAVPPNVPQVVTSLVDFLHEKVSAAPGLFRVPFENVRTRGVLAKIANAFHTNRANSVKLSAIGGNAYDVGEALISLFSALPQRVLEKPEITSVVDSMPLDSFPTRDFINSVLNKHVSGKTRAALAHAATLIKRIDDERAQTSLPTDTAAVCATFARCFFAESDDSADEPSRRRVAFVGALAGCHPSFIDSYRAHEVQAAETSIFTPNWTLFAPAFPSAPSTSSQPPSDASGPATGNLIDL